MKPVLDKFSQITAERLFARHPAWRGLEVIEPDKDGDGYFTLTISAPPGADVQSGLLVSTYGGELTIGFDAYHNHYFEIVGDGKYKEIDYGLDFLTQLLNEEVAAISWWKDSHCRLAASIEAGQEPSPPTFTLDFNRIRIRSWKGNLNADIKV